MAGPTYYFGDVHEPVNWAMLTPGFGDEFLTKLEPDLIYFLNIGFTYSNRYTAYGVEQMVGVGVGLFRPSPSSESSICSLI